MNKEYSNHIGLPIGKVIEIKKDKIKIKLNPGEVINQNDGIRFLNSNPIYLKAINVRVTGLN